MTENWRESLSRPSTTAYINTPGNYAKRTNFEQKSPIDQFHENIQAILSAANPSYLTNHPVAGPCFFTGIVATTEEFMRSLFGKLIAMCPDCQAHSTQKEINLGSAIWHGQGVFSRGAFENASFASGKNIKRTVSDFLGHEIDQKSRVHGTFNEYEKICEIRHCAVHSGTTFPGKNAVKLKLSPTDGSPMLNIGFPEVQECAEICTSLAVSLNLDLFEVIAERWATTWRSHLSWSPDKEHEKFKDIWNLFYSKFDSDRSLISSPLTLTKCKNRVLKEFP